MKIKRRHRSRRRSRRQFVIISVCLLVFVLVLGTAYSAFSTNLSLNASGEVIQPEYVSIGGNDVELVLSGDGLYEDSYESGRYIYRGADPDNYIELNGELYRIIAKEEDGTYKVIRSSSLGGKVFDPGYSTSIDDDILTTTASSVEGTRYSSSSDDYCSVADETTYYGCKAWGSNTTTLDSSGNNVTTMPWVIGGDEKNLPDDEAYINMYLNQTYYNSLDLSIQEVIETHLFNIGVVSYDSSYTLSDNLSQEQTYKWRGNVGLASPTDYVKATTNEVCTNLYSYNNTSGCYNTVSSDNWMYIDSAWWLLSPYSYLESYSMWRVNAYGFLDSLVTYNSSTVRPVLYLSSDIQFDSSTDGSYSNPYKVIS